METILALVWLLGSIVCPVWYWKIEGKRSASEMIRQGNLEKARDEVFFMFLFVVLWPLLITLIALIYISQNFEPFGKWFEKSIGMVTKPIADKVLSWLLPS